MEAVLFDIGGVVLRVNNLMEKAYKIFQVEDRDQFWQIFNEVCMAACRGEQSLAECWQEMARRMNVAINEEAQQTLWIEEFEQDIEVDRAVIALIDKLKNNYKVGVVSNTIDEHAQVIRDMGIYDHFEEVVLSHEVGIAKDDPKIFEIALEKLDVSADKTVFIDDVEKFALSAEKKGIKGIVFKDAKTLKNDLRALGYEI